jgi:hypothetical protein
MRTEHHNPISKSFNSNLSHYHLYHIINLVKETTQPTKMQFKLSAVIFACAIAYGVMASPVPVPAPDSTELDLSTDYVELFRENATTEGFSLVYYGPGEDAAVLATKTVREEPARIEERGSCSTTAAPGCYTSHSSRNDVCDALVTELQGDGNVAVPQAPRQICYEGNAESNPWCCVSWHNVVPGLVKGDLAGYADTSKQPFILIRFPLRDADSLQS